MWVARLRAVRAVVVVAVAVLLFASEAHACLSGPGNGTAAQGDCLDGGDSTPIELIVATVAVSVLPVHYYSEAITKGVRGMSTGTKIVSGVIGGSLVIALPAILHAGYDNETRNTEGFLLAGAILGTPALLGGIVGLVLGNDAPDASPTGALVACTNDGCGLAMPVPTLRANSVAVPLVAARW